MRLLTTVTDNSIRWEAGLGLNNINYSLYQKIKELTVFRITLWFNCDACEVEIKWGEVVCKCCITDGCGAVFCLTESATTTPPPPGIRTPLLSCDGIRVLFACCRGDVWLSNVEFVELEVEPRLFVFECARCEPVVSCWITEDAPFWGVKLIGKCSAGFRVCFVPLDSTEKKRRIISLLCRLNRSSIGGL